MDWSSGDWRKRCGVKSTAPNTTNKLNKTISNIIVHNTIDRFVEQHWAIFVNVLCFYTIREQCWAHARYMVEMSVYTQVKETIYRYICCLVLSSQSLLRVRCQSRQRVDAQRSHNCKMWMIVLEYMKNVCGVWRRVELSCFFFNFFFLLYSNIVLNVILFWF